MESLESGFGSRSPQREMIHHTSMFLQRSAVVVRLFSAGAASIRGIELALFVLLCLHSRYRKILIHQTNNMTLSFSPEAKNGLVLLSKTVNTCKSFGFSAGITLGPFNASGKFDKNKCVTLVYGRA